MHVVATLLLSMGEPVRVSGQDKTVVLVFDFLPDLRVGKCDREINSKNLGLHGIPE